MTRQLIMLLIMGNILGEFNRSTKRPKILQESSRANVHTLASVFSSALWLYSFQVLMPPLTSTLGSVLGCTSLRNLSAAAAAPRPSAMAQTFGVRRGEDAS